MELQKSLMAKSTMSLNEDLVQEFDNQEVCDVIFTAEGKTIGAHKVVLKVRSKHLYEMASGWSHGSPPIAIEDMSYDAFKTLLRYMYSGQIDLTDVFTFLAASTCFKMDLLEELCVDYITNSMNEENVCDYMNEALNFRSIKLQKKCNTLFSEKTSEIIKTDSFKKLTQSALSTLLDVDQTDALEIVTFQRIKLWMEQQCRDQGLPVNGANMRHVIGDALYKIPFPTMTVQDFANSVTTLQGFLTDAEEAQIFRKMTVFDNKDITCPFSQKFRCQKSKYYAGFCDIDQLCKEKLLYRYGCQEALDIGLMLKHVKDLPDGKDMFEPSFLILLQCCADIANSSGTINHSNRDNQGTRNELCDEF